MRRPLLVSVAAACLAWVRAELDISVGSNTRHEKKNAGAYR